MFTSLPSGSWFFADNLCVGCLAWFSHAVSEHNRGVRMDCSRVLVFSGAYPETFVLAPYMALHAKPAPQLVSKLERVLSTLQEKAEV